MNKLCWWMAGALSRMLDGDEREAVRGDIAEAGENGREALRDVVGLVLRRQAAPWLDWRPWLALLGLVAPCGWLIMRQASTLGRGYAEFFWILRNHADLDPEVLEQTGLTPGNELSRVLSVSLLIVCWCWSSGFVLGSLSRRTVWINGALFSAFLVLPAITVSRQLYPYEVQGPLPLRFYTVIFPVIQQLILAVVPALWGMRASLRGDNPLATRRGLWVASMVTAWAASYWLLRAPQPAWQMRVLMLSAYWPIGYTLATAQ